MQNDYEHYNINYYGYYFEMEAELYALNKLLKYLKENGLLSDNLRCQYEKERELILFRMHNFHMYPFLKRVHEIMQMEFIEAPSWLKAFYNEDGTFKTVGEILNVCNIDETVLNMFFSSEDFLNSIDFSLLTIEQQNIIINALQASYNLDIERYKNNFKFLKGGIITQKMVLKANSEITKRLVYYSKKLEELKKTMSLNNINENSEEFKK